MGANRQNVQRIVHDLERDGHVRFQPNPHHRQAHLVVLTEQGQQAYDDAMRLQAPWVNALSDGLNPDDIQATRKLLTLLRERLERADRVYTAEMRPFEVTAVSTHPGIAAPGDGGDIHGAQAAEATAGEIFLRARLSSVVPTKACASSLRSKTWGATPRLVRASSILRRRKALVA